MKPDEFFDSCIADAMMVIGGYEDRMNDKWEMARYSAYLTYCTVTKVEDRVDIYDFHPLPNDPPKELRPKSGFDAFVERMKQQGHLKSNVFPKQNG